MDLFIHSLYQNLIHQKKENGTETIRKYAGAYYQRTGIYYMNHGITYGTENGDFLFYFIFTFVSESLKMASETQMFL